ncbi:RNA-binding S4 domain-containing protein [Myxococcota bacterium]
MIVAAQVRLIHKPMSQDLDVTTPVRGSESTAEGHGALHGPRSGAADPRAAGVRVDRWLCAARIYASRTQAQAACTGGQVKVNGASVRPSHPVKVGDRITARPRRGLLTLDIIQLEEKRQSPKRARELYQELSPPSPPEARSAPRSRGAGRPTKADRRALERLRRA